MVSGTSRKKLGRILRLSEKSYFHCSKEQPATLISCLGACSRTPIDTTCKELCVREQSQTLPGSTSSKIMLMFYKLPSVLHACVAADFGSQDLCGYQRAGPESQATLP